MASSHPLLYVAAESARKCRLLNHSPLRYLLSAVMAGALIGVVLMVSLILGQALQQAGSPLFYAATAGFFGTALCAIIILKLELFTSNVMYMTVGVLSGRARYADLGKSWLLVYIGNLLGVLLFALIYCQTGGLAQLAPNHLLFSVVDHKVAGSAWAIFWKGALCNWIICLAVWLPLRLQNEMARLTITMLLVFVFFFSGYEHSIANMAFFALDAMASTGGVLSMQAILHNLLPATAGNIVGGAIGVAACQYCLDREVLASLPVEAEVAIAEV